MLMKKVVLSQTKEVIAQVFCQKSLKKIKVLGETYKLSYDKRLLKKTPESTPVAVDCLDGTWQIHSRELINAIQEEDFAKVVNLTHTWEKYYGFGQLNNSDYELVRKDEYEGANGEFLIAGLSPSLLKKVKQYLWENDPMYEATKVIAYHNHRLDGDEY